ncbi:MAG: hypothetical protein ACYDAY_05025 [Candidatus Dormibacteria bacterium]
MENNDTGAVIDLGVRFLMTNPELVRVASEAAPALGVPIRQLLEDTVRRARRESENRSLAV